MIPNDVATRINEIISIMESIIEKPHQNSKVVHHAQVSLLDFSDEVRKGDNDLAVEKDAETLAVAGDDTTRTQQEKEARTVGGIPSR